MPFGHLLRTSYGNALRERLEVTLLADGVTSGVPHNAPDATRTFDQLRLSMRSEYSDDVVMGLAKVEAAASVAADFDDLVSLRRAVIERVAPFIAESPEAWGPRFSGAVLGNTSLEDHSAWASTGSGSIMTIPLIHAARLGDEEVLALTATTHLSLEGMGAAMATLAAMRAASERATGIGPVVEAAAAGYATGIVRGREIADRLRVDLVPPRPLVELLDPSGPPVMTAVREPSDFISARYVLAVAMRAFASAANSENPLATVIESAARSGDPDTAAVVAASLLHARMGDELTGELCSLRSSLNMADAMTVLRGLDTVSSGKNSEVQR